MIFDFESEDGLYRYEFGFRNNHIIINSYNLSNGSSSSTGRRIENRKIVWHSELEDSFLNLTPDAKNYITKLVRLMAFL
jgi:hypothetical protein